MAPRGEWPRGRVGHGCLFVPGGSGRVLLLGGADPAGAFADAHFVELGEGRAGRGAGPPLFPLTAPRPARRRAPLGPGCLERTAAALRARHVPVRLPSPAPLGVRWRAPGREPELRPSAGPR